MQGGVTKTGNSHPRRLLIEAAWHHRARYRPGQDAPTLGRASPAARARGQAAIGACTPVGSASISARDAPGVYSARACTVLTALGRLLIDEHPNHPQALLDRARRPGRSLGPLARSLETFFTERVWRCRPITPSNSRGAAHASHRRLPFPRPRRLRPYAANGSLHPPGRPRQHHGPQAGGRRVRHGTRGPQ